MEDVLERKDILLREAALEDSDDILRWRNDETTRKNSFNMETITLKEHEKWFKKALNDPDKLILIGLLSGEKLGVVRFEKRGENTVEVNINLSPDKRGMSLGSQFLKRAVDYFLYDFPASKLIAKIKSHNSASIKTFQKAGFIYKEPFSYGVLFEFSPTK